MEPDEHSSDDTTERPRFLRQYALTGARARSRGEDLPLDALVRTVRGALIDDVTPEQRAICSLCERPIAVAEVAARMHFHLGIARVLVSDLAAMGMVEIATASHDESGPDLSTLERLLDDLQAL
jgi:hypothetical protein